MILGVGLDWVENRRIALALDRFGEQFARRILLPAEWEYCRSHKNPSPHVAARFAAKEAASKVLGVGIGKQLGWLDLEILRAQNAPPALAFHGRGLEVFGRLGGRRTFLSLTHTDGHSAAVVILED